MERRKDLDFAKGIGIILMVLGHCYSAGNGELIRTWFYSFHMPLFMLVSGYLFSYSFRKRNLADLLEHRLRSMLHPIIMATILNNVLMLVPTFVLSDRADVLFGSLFKKHGSLQQAEIYRE